jgi:hypothetical protein
MQPSFLTANKNKRSARKEMIKIFDNLTNCATPLIPPARSTAAAVYCLLSWAGPYADF